MKLNDPQLVRDEYASEAGLEARRSIYVHADDRDTAKDASLRILRGSGADVPAFEGPLAATTRVSIFVARR